MNDSKKVNNLIWTSKAPRSSLKRIKYDARTLDKSLDFHDFKNIKISNLNHYSKYGLPSGWININKIHR